MYFALCTCLIAQLCSTLWDPIGCSPPGSSVHGIFQARILEWVAISFFKGFFPPQGSNLALLSLLHWQVDSLPLPPGKPIFCIIVYSFSFLLERPWFNFREEKRVLMAPQSPRKLKVFLEVCICVCVIARGRHHPSWQYTIHIIDIFIKAENLPWGMPDIPQYVSITYLNTLYWSGHQKVILNQLFWSLLGYNQEFHVKRKTQPRCKGCNNSSVTSIW